MNSASILIKDTNGQLIGNVLKHNSDRPAITAWLTNETNKERELVVALDNVRVDAIPNMMDATYITFLAYNGTLGLSKKVFTTVVAQNSDTLDLSNLPVIYYNPAELNVPAKDLLEDVVIDIKMYNGTVDVLRYSEGVLNNGEKSYFVKSQQAYPTTITSMPNVAGGRVFMDGWYSYTTIIFRNLPPGSSVVEGVFYSFDGLIFKASTSGSVYYNSANEVVIVPTGSLDPEEGDVQTLNTYYEDLLFGLNENSGISAMGNSVYIHSQLLVTDQLRDSITAEAIEAAMNPCQECLNYIDFQNWQKLTLKRMSASVMFENGLFENAQIIVESARALCSVAKYNARC
jgi:hypothetical protein